MELQHTYKDSIRLIQTKNTKPRRRIFYTIEKKTNLIHINQTRRQGEKKKKNEINKSLWKKISIFVIRTFSLRWSSPAWSVQGLWSARLFGHRRKRRGLEELEKRKDQRSRHKWNYNVDLICLLSRHKTSRGLYIRKTLWVRVGKAQGFLILFGIELSFSSWKPPVLPTNLY